MDKLHIKIHKKIKENGVPDYLVWCTKEEHKFLHNLIKEYRKLWLKDGDGV